MHINSIDYLYRVDFATTRSLCTIFVLTEEQNDFFNINQPALG